MSTPYSDIIRDLSRPLSPLPTAEATTIPRPIPARAVLFDVYGTLFISGSGDVGSSDAQGQADALVAALHAVGLELRGDPAQPLDVLTEVIQEHHAKARAVGIDYPEVDIIKVWEDVVNKLVGGGRLREPPRDVNWRELAVHYEGRANPTWPMPHLLGCLARLRQGEVVLGIVSNAQYFTLELFPAYLGQTPEGLGFDPALQFYSYRFGRAKPGEFLYRLATEALSERGIAPDEVRYVGNDVLKDIQPAKSTGFHTALFAGDARSLRRREGDPRVTGVCPDFVVTDLLAVADCIVI
jgi:putative hydrolase of the HAD superfamily